MPLGWPFYKKDNKKVNRQTEDAGDDDDEDPVFQADKTRAERLLWLFVDLDARAKAVFFSLMIRPSVQYKYMDSFLRALEDYNVSMYTFSCSID